MGSNFLDDEARIFSTGRLRRRSCKLDSKTPVAEGVLLPDVGFLPTLRLPSKEGDLTPEPTFSAAFGAGLGPFEEESFPRAKAIFLRSRTASSFKTRRFHAVSFATRDIPKTVNLKIIKHGTARW